MTVLIGAAGNTLTPAYLAIVSKGYVVFSSGASMIAERDGNKFVADDPLQLLGLIALVESRGENWAATDEEIDDFVARFGSSAG